jgi:hypothetical protein
VSAPCPEYGFTFACRLASPLDADAARALRDAFARVLESRGLAADGGDGRWHHVISRDGGQAIDADREALRAWAASRPDVADVTVGPLVDLDDPDA